MNWQATVIFHFDAEDSQEARKTLDLILDSGIGMVNSRFTLASAYGWARGEVVSVKPSVSQS